VTHPLKAYLVETETTESDFADKVGTTASYVSQIITAHRWPGRALANKIETATGGLVKAADVLTWKPGRAA
jgi:hypothetical protein